MRCAISSSTRLLSVALETGRVYLHHAARSKGKETPVNLLGFKDGTANPDGSNKTLMDEVVWVTASRVNQRGRWAVPTRRCELSSSTSSSGIVPRLKSSRLFFGRDKHSGAPLGMKLEHDVPDYSRDPEGDVIALIAIFVWLTRAPKRPSPA